MSLKHQNFKSVTGGLMFPEQEAEAAAGRGRTAASEDQPASLTMNTATTPVKSRQGTLHLPSAAMCVGVLPGLCAYSGSSDSDSSSDSEGSVDAIMSPYPRHSRAYR